MPVWMMGLTLMAADTIAVAPPRDSWFGPDKVKHAVVGFAVQGGAYAAMRGISTHEGALTGAALVSVGMSLLKERYDRGRTGFSVRDLAWDVVGIALASAIVSHAPRR